MKFQQLYTLLFETDEFSVQYKLKKAHEAAMSQRDKPERVMEEVVHNLYRIPCPQIIKWGLEHYGDLSHRAQQMRQSIPNVKEKLEKSYSRSIAGHTRIWTAQEEIESGLESDILYKIISSGIFDIPETDLEYKKYEYVRKNYKELIQLEKKKASDIICVELDKYIEAHEKYNLPVTKLGRDGKLFAILFAKYCKAVLQETDYIYFYLTQLRALRLNMLKWVDDYYALETEEERTDKFLEGFEEH